MSIAGNDPPARQVPFDAHIELLQSLLADREAIVEKIQGLLNAQRKPAEYLQDGPLLARHFEDCLFSLAPATARHARLRSQLDEVHHASGFRPRPIPGLHNGPADPAELMMRAFHLWSQTRWPGRGGRVRYAHTLFNLYVVRCLELLAMRLWDAGPAAAADRLSRVQAVLDHLWRIRTADQPVLVRDARWLIQLAQSLATDELGAYFTVAEQVAGSFTAEDRLAIHAAGVRMAAGHLRSQIRYHAMKPGASLDDVALLSITRTSNALDFALLVQDLVPLLESYENACRGGDAPTRLRLADAVCQAISPDPELFVNRVELLGPYSMIDHLFITTERDGHAAYTHVGRRHVQLLREYEERIGRVAQRLYEDCPRFRPQPGMYSPYGVLYGFSADLIKHMALKSSQPDAVSHFSLEDVFAGDDASGDKLAWVTGWRKLPHLKREVQRLFEYPQQFAEEIFTRIEHALRRRVCGDADSVPRTGRLLVRREGQASADPEPSPTPDLPIRYIGSSDAQIVAARKAHAADQAQLLDDRREGRCLLSYETPGGWTGITKALLTEVLAAGHDVNVVGLPADAVDRVQLMCPGLVVVPETAGS